MTLNDIPWWLWCYWAFLAVFLVIAEVWLIYGFIHRRGPIFGHDRYR